MKIITIMHELSKIQGIINLIESKFALNIKGKKVTRIVLGVGRYSNYDADDIRECFKLAAKDTRFDQANVEIRQIPLRVKCGICANVSTLEIDEGAREEDAIGLLCPECRGPADLISPNEFIVDSIEVE